MKKTQKYHIAVLLLGLTVSALSRADIIGYDLNSNHLPSLERFVGHTNYAQDIFPSSNDGSQTYHFDSINLSDIPEGLVDTSHLGFLDNIGLIMPSAEFTFFGIVDTVNASNPDDYVEAQWEFDIESVSDISVAMDFAAMGDFETSDDYQLNFAIDYGEFFPLFELKTQTQLTQSYTMANGNQKSIADPLSIAVRNSNVFYSLDNNFTTYTSNVSESGSHLTIQLLTKADGGTEAFGFSDMRVFGEMMLIEEIEHLPELEGPTEPPLSIPNELEEDISNEEPSPIVLLPIETPTPSPAVNQVPEPSSFMLMALPMLGLISRFKAKVLV